MIIAMRATCPECGSHDVRRLGVDPGSHEDLLECRECGAMADKRDFR